MTTRLRAVDVFSATGKAKTLLDGVQAKLGMTPNMMKTMVQSTAVLDAYLKFSGALAEGALSAKLREQIALTVGEENSCDYCVAAHCAIGKMVGLTPEQISESRSASSDDPKVDAALRFARLLVEQRGRVDDEDLAALRQKGYGDGEIAEIVGAVALNIFTNYFNHVAGTAIDFPRAPQLAVT